MEITTLLGLVAAIALLIIGIVSGNGQLLDFYDFASVVITIGGSLAALCMAFSLQELLSLGKIISKAFKPSMYDAVQGINTIVELANVARKEGMLALEENVEELEETFLRKGVMLIVDGTDPDLVKSIMEAELTSIEGRHSKGIGMVDMLGSMGPAYGMLGTLIGLVIMLNNLSDPDSIGSGMAAALITTFYGSVIANAFAIPIANKLKTISGQEIMFKEILLEGILSIQAGENPRIIEEKLYSFLPAVAKLAAQEEQELQEGQQLDSDEE